MSRSAGWWLGQTQEMTHGFRRSASLSLFLTAANPRPREILACSDCLFASRSPSLSMALHLMFPALPAGDAEPTCLEEWLDLTEADAGFLHSVF